MISAPKRIQKRETNGIEVGVIGSGKERIKKIIHSYFPIFNTSIIAIRIESQIKRSIPAP